MLLGIASCALAETQTITVTGTASILADPDVAIISFGIRTSEKNTETSANRNAEIMKQVINALKELGIKEEDITTEWFNVYTGYTYVETGEREVLNYVVDNTLTVKTTPDLAGKVIDTAIRSGATECNGVSYNTSKKEELYDEVLLLAIKEGKRKAELIAASQGMKITGTVSVKESYGSYTGVYYNKTMSNESSVDSAGYMPTTIAAEKINISATAEMVFNAAQANDIGAKINMDDIVDNQLTDVEYQSIIVTTEP
jgi:uncharacterized protein YggE